MSTIAGKIKVVVPDQALAVGASATVNGALITKGTATDMSIILSNSGSSGTVTPIVQGTNDGSTFTTVTADKGSLVALVGAASVQNAHFQNLQFKQYRVQYTSAAVSGTTATDIALLYPMADSFDATVQ